MHSKFPEKWRFETISKLLFSSSTANALVSTNSDQINLILRSNDRPMFVLLEMVQQFDGDAAEALRWP